MPTQKKKATKKAAVKKKAPLKKKRAAKKTATKKALPKSRKPTAKKSTVIKKKTSPKKSVVAKKKPTAKKNITPVNETMVSIKQKETIRKNIAVNELNQKKVIVQTEQLSLPLPEPEKKQRKKEFFKRLKGLKSVRNYDPHHFLLNKVRKGGPKPSGKKPLW